MEVKNIIGVLLFILPGLLAQGLSNKLDFGSGKKKSEFLEIACGIALSFPIMFLVLIAMEFLYGLSTITGLIKKIDEIDYLKVLIVYLFGFSVIFGILINPAKKIFYKVINYIRKEKNMMKIDDGSCWRRFTVDVNEKRYLRITKDGKTYKGFVETYSLPDEEREIILHMPENAESYPEAFDLLRKKKIYFNMEKGIIIEDYDTNKFFEKISELSK